MTLNAKIGGFMDFLAAATQNHSQDSAMVSLYIIILYALRYDCNNIGVFFIPKSRTDFRCTISLYCECNNLLFSTFLMHSIWWNGLQRPILQHNLWYFVRWCCHLGNRFTTPSLALGVVKHFFYSQAQVYIRPIDCIDWVVTFQCAKAATAFIAS